MMLLILIYVLCESVSKHYNVKSIKNTIVLKGYGGFEQVQEAGHCYLTDESFQCKNGYDDTYPIST